MSLPSVMWPAGMAVRKAPAGPPDELRSLAASRCAWVVLRSKLDSMSAWHASSPSSSRAAAPQAACSCCPRTPLAGPSLLCLLCTAPRTVRGGCSTAPKRRRLWPLAEGRAQLAPPSGCTLLGQHRPRTQRLRLRPTACATLAPHDAAGASSAYPGRCTPCPLAPCGGSTVEWTDCDVADSCSCNVRTYLYIYGGCHAVVVLVV